MATPNQRGKNSQAVRVPGSSQFKGQPGVKEWLVASNDLQTILDRNHLISRPPFAGHGAVYHWQTTTQMLPWAFMAGANFDVTPHIEIGAEGHIRTDSRDAWLVPVEENSAVALIAHWLRSKA